MTDHADRLRRTLAAIDEANGANPNVVDSEGRAAELLYGERMSAALVIRLEGIDLRSRIARGS